MDTAALLITLDYQRERIQELANLIESMRLFVPERYWSEMDGFIEKARNLPPIERVE